MCLNVYVYISIILSNGSMYCVDPFSHYKFNMFPCVHMSDHYLFLVPVTIEVMCLGHERETVMLSVLD